MFTDERGVVDRAGSGIGVSKDGPGVGGSEGTGENISREISLSSWGLKIIKINWGGKLKTKFRVAKTFLNPSVQKSVHFQKKSVQYWILDIGYRIQDTGYRILDTGYWIQDTG